MALPKIVRGRRLLVAGALVASALTFAGPEGTNAQSPEAQACNEPARRVFLYASQLPNSPEGDVRIGYGLTPDSASTPGPMMEMIEGECVAITLTNLVPAATLLALQDEPGPIGVSLHVHGVKYTVNSDGTAHTNSYVPPGETRTYKWYAAPRLAVAGRVVSLGTAGYWWYHDHVVGTTHGTGGLNAGLFGGLVVRRPGDLRPDHTYTIVMGPQQSINLRHYPDTDCDPANPVASNRCLLAKQGERVEFIVIGVGNDFHTFHLHGHNWANNRTGILNTHLDETALIDNKTVGPADSFGFQIIAGESVGTGAWMLHCHVQSHSDVGMVTFFHVTDGTAIPAQTGGMVPGHSHH